jgi:HAD superfamily hydrolase (TIGR01509 family)
VTGTGSRLRGVLLDVDGTLVDSNDAHARAWVEALGEAGFAIPFERVRPLIGMGGDKLLPLVSGLEDDDPRGKRIVERRMEIFLARELPTVRALPKARELLVHMKSRGLRLGVATSARDEELEPLLDRAAVADLFAARTSSSDADRSKPDPDIVQAALDALGCEREQVVMIGDTPYDVEAAGRAGLPAIAFRSGGWDDARLAAARAIYDGPWDLLERFDDSPLAARG